jgi:hypothetical protein
MTPVIDAAGNPDSGNRIRRWSRTVSVATLPVTVAAVEAATHGVTGAETFRHRQATQKGAVTGHHGPSPASADECGQEGV